MDLIANEARSASTSSDCASAASSAPGAACQHDRLICHCFRVTESQLRETVVERQLQTLCEIRRQLGAGGGCTACHRRIKDVLAGTAAAAATPECPPAAASRYLPSEPAPICIAR